LSDRFIPRFSNADDRFLWADNVRFGPDSWLYININQLHRAAIFTGKTTDSATPPYQRPIQI
jgi:hypothetical protein